MPTDADEGLHELKSHQGLLVVMCIVCRFLVRYKIGHDEDRIAIASLCRHVDDQALVQKCRKRVQREMKEIAAASGCEVDKGRAERPVMLLQTIVQCRDDRRLVRGVVFQRLNFPREHRNELLFAGASLPILLKTVLQNLSLTYRPLRGQDHEERRAFGVSKKSRASASRVLGLKMDVGSDHGSLLGARSSRSTVVVVRVS